MRPTDRNTLLDHIKAHPVEGSVADKRAAFSARLAAPDDLGTPQIFAETDGLRFGGAGSIRALYLHGGGYVLGSPRDQSVAINRLAQGLGAPIFAPAYPLAPERVWPAPLDCVLSVLDAMDEPVALFGSSAGGHLALVAALHRPDAISALGLFSPNTDRTGRSNTREPNTPLDAMNSDKGDREFSDIAMPDIADDDPDASPWLGDIASLPPTCLCATEGEVLLGDTLLLARALEAAGVENDVFIADFEAAGMHMFESWPDILPAGAGALDRAANFVRRFLAT